MTAGGKEVPAPDCVQLRIGARRVQIPTAHVREVAAAEVVTPVPTAPEPIAGVAQLRGQILPVLDLALPVRAVRPNPALVVVEWGPTRAALLVDQVLGVQPAEPESERLDVGALFDRVRAAIARQGEG